MNHLVKLIGITIIAAILLGTAGIALADDQATPTPTPTADVDEDTAYQGLVGTITSLTDNVIKLDTMAHGEVAITLTDQTTYKIPSQKVATQDEVVAVGNRVAVLATNDVDGKYTAVRVMFVPNKATRKHITGVVVSVEGQTMTITNAKGENITIDIPEGVKASAVGKLISAAVRQTTDKDRPVATGVQTAEEVQARIQTHLDEIAAKKAEKQADKEQKGKDIERLSQQLERLSEKHEEALTRVLEKVQNEKAKEAIQQAIEKSKQGHEKAKGSGK